MENKVYSSFMSEELKQDYQQNKVMAVLAYFLFFLPLLGCPSSRYARFHSNQALILFLMNLAISLLRIIPLVGGIVWSIGGLASLALMVLGMVNAGTGKMNRLPFVGQFDLIR